MRIVLGTIAAIVPALLVFSIAASVAFCWGTSHLGMYRFPVVTWWQYLPYHGYRRDWDDWLLYGALFGLVPSIPLCVRIMWHTWLRSVLPGTAQQRPLHGETRFASDSELRRAGFYTERSGDYGE